jgi:twinkle protein
VIKECMFCSKPTHGKLDNLYKLGVKCEGGCFYCHRCGSKGSWYDFLQHLYNIQCSEIFTLRNEKLHTEA